VEPGGAALVDVSVASLWASPGMARAVDAPSLGNPVDVHAWLDPMSVADRLWLVDKLVTQALYGDRVQVDAIAGDWAKVVVLGQPSSQDGRGYPGWLRTAQLVAEPRRGGGSGATAFVTARTTALRDAADRSRALLELSFGTRLPVVETSADRAWVTVATPDGLAVLAASDVSVTTSTGAQARAAGTTGADLVRTAQAFAGLPYLWAGTSAYGFDCSGFTMLVYAAHGITIPRDADDQAAAGTPVDVAHLQPGDLLFYATDGGRGAIHHVSMYVGDGIMTQSPATGKTVETVPVATPAYASEFWGARRYLGA
jgi:cell wall-associated NlpC family hydrolase